MQPKKNLALLGVGILFLLTACNKDKNNVNTDPNAVIAHVKFFTTKGEIIVQLENRMAPITSTNFLKLVNQKFYDGIIFHRVISGFMVQGGDPTGTGTGGPGYTIEDEFNENLSNQEKTISMANTGAPNSGGSQFFFNMTDNSFLDADKSPTSSSHAVFGKVISGYEVVEAISFVRVNAQDRPDVNIVIDSIRQMN